MPDWITHLGTAYVGARVARVSEVQLVLFGAVLPDIMMPAFVVMDLLQLPVSLHAFAYLLPYQSLLIVSLLGAAIAVLHSRPVRCFLLISGGALSHFVLDALETDIDCGLRIFYPFSFDSLSLGWLEGTATLPPPVFWFSAIALAFALRNPANNLPALAFKPTSKKLCYTVSLLALAALIPYMTRQTIVDQNVHALAFLQNPSAWQGRRVDLCFTEVVSAAPVKIKEFERHFELVTDGLVPGDRVSVRGLYRNGKIYPDRLHVHRGFSEAWLSLAGLAAFFTFWLYGSRPINSQTQAPPK